MDLERARFNMIEQQIRPWEVLDANVLGLLEQRPRDTFVPEECRKLAYADMRIPLEGGQVMMLPREEARLLQALQVKERDAVLEVGTGSGYLTALLADLARHVTSVEILPGLSERAGRTLASLGIRNVTLEVGDARHGWPRGAPYAAIALTGSVHALDPAILEQLEVGGRLFVIVGDAPAMEARLVTRTSAQQWDTESLFETVVPSLAGAQADPHFTF